MIVMLAFLCVYVSCMLGNNQVLKDLDKMYQVILENHPGVYNEQDPGFVKSMNHAYQEARNKSGYVHTKDDHVRVCVRQQSISAQPTRLPQNFSVISFTDDIAWVVVPNLYPITEEKILLEHLIDQMPSLRHKKYIVFDLRGNGGGSSLWGTRILESLFTKDYVTQKLYARYKGWYE